MPIFYRPIPSCSALHFTRLHPTQFHYTKFHWAKLHCTVLNYAALHHTKLHCAKLHSIKRNYISLHCTALHYTALCCTAMHRTTFFRLKNCSCSWQTLSDANRRHSLFHWTLLSIADQSSIEITVQWIAVRWGWLTGGTPDTWLVGHLTVARGSKQGDQWSVHIIHITFFLKE